MKDMSGDLLEQPSLIGIRFEKGIQIDEVLAQVAKQLRDRNLNVAGLVQKRGNGTSDSDRRQMCLQDLTTGDLHPITENRGPNARGCHLDRQALSILAQSLEASLSPNVDVLILNRFGQAESEGRGFRGAIEKALALEVPVIVAYRDSFQAEWSEFEGGLATTAQPTAKDILAQISGTAKAA